MNRRDDGNGLERAIVAGFALMVLFWLVVAALLGFAVYGIAMVIS